MTNPLKPLTAIESAFIDALILDPKRVAAHAHAKVFGTEGRASSEGAAMYMRDSRIIHEIAQRDYATMNRTSLEVDRLTRHLVDLVEAHASELTEYRRGACRYCYGVKHRYQFTNAELERALEDYRQGNDAAQSRRTGPKPPPDPDCFFFDYKGGTGFDPRKTPHIDCPECFGMGEGREFIHDTRSLSGEARRLYAGVQVTKEGLKILTRNQDKALEMALRVSGMLSEKDNGEDEDNTPPTVSITYAEEDASDPDGPVNPAAP